MVRPALGAVNIGDETVFAEIKFIIREGFLARAEAELETAQTVVRFRGSAQVQIPSAMAGEPFDGFPHQ